MIIYWLNISALWGSEFKMDSETPDCLDWIHFGNVLLVSLSQVLIAKINKEGFW